MLLARFTSERVSAGEEEGLWWTMGGLNPEEDVLVEGREEEEDLCVRAS